MLCDVSKLTSVISQHVSGSQLLISHGNSVSEIAYRLPSEGAHNGSFQRLFNYLDLHLQSLGVESYGLTDSSLEEVCIWCSLAIGISIVWSLSCMHLVFSGYRDLHCVELVLYAFGVLWL